MHSIRPPRLYTLANFILGCKLALASRGRMSHLQALEELAPPPEKTFGAIAAALFALLAGVALLLAVVRSVGHVAPTAMEQAAPVVSAYGVAIGVAFVVFAAFSWLLFRLGRSVTRFYVRMCHIGHAHRCEVAARSPTLRCYTSED